jgi:hypothetical protein
MSKYYYQIVIDGFSNDKESVMQTYFDLQAKVWYTVGYIYEPKFFEIEGRDSDL